MSLIRSIVDSIARRLETADFFRTVPQIPVIVEDHKDVEKSIERAMNSAGAFCLVSYASAETDSSDTPGPYLSDTTFTVTVSEIPSVWRSKSNRPPSATMIAEAIMRLVHHHQPTDDNGSALSGGVLIFNGASIQPNDSFLQHVVSFTIPLGLSNQSPTR